MQVALKVLDKAHIKQKGAESKIKSEMQILRRLHHPHLLNLFDVIVTQKKLVLVTEYLSGGELYTLIERSGRVDEQTANKIIRQLLSAVEYCHYHSVAHRDIKPENILLDARGDLKLADFGLARLMRDGELLRTACGSPNYASPEILSGRVYSGPECDVWSSGVVLFALVAGSLPFDEASTMVLFSKIKASQYEFPYHFSLLLKDLIARMLDPDPTARITIHQIKKHPWYTGTCPVYMKTMKLSLRCEDELDEEILDQVLRDPEMRALCESAETFKEWIARYELNQATVTYRILLHYKIEAIRRDGALSYPEPPLFQAADVRSRAVRTELAPHNWTCGFRTGLRLHQFVNELLTLFKEQNFEWRFLNRFQFRVQSRWKRLKFHLALYSLEPSTVVDFRLVAGSVMEFFELVGSAFSTLANLEQVGVS